MSGVVAALALACAATFAAAGTDAIVRQHLDAGRVQFSGMDINADGIPDSIRVDRINKTLSYFTGDKRQNFTRFDPTALPEEDRRFVPDVLIEKDLDGDKIDDLILCNRAYLQKYADNEPVLLRILAAGTYLGQPKGTYQSLLAAPLSEEAKKTILDRARRAIFPEP
jgi:hypothetical protein